MEVYTTVVGFFQSGGVFMYPIMLVLALGLAIAIERHLYLMRQRRINGRTWGQLQPLLKEQRFADAAQLADQSTAPLAQILAFGLLRADSAAQIAEIETALEEGLMEVVPKLEKRTHYLATFANVATLLGLLGTILGLIQAFTAVAQADPAQKADLLSSSISVAMNTTAFGLMVAIPLLLIHSVLQTRTNELVDYLETVSVKFLNAVSHRGSRG